MDTGTSVARTRFRVERLPNAGRDGYPVRVATVLPDPLCSSLSDTAVFHGSPSGATTHAVLCIGSQPLHTYFNRSLRHYQSRVVHDPAVAVRRAQLVSFDVYVAYDAEEPARTVTAWRKIRRVDENTPFILIGRRALLDEITGELRSGYDAFLDESGDPSSIPEAMESMLLFASERSLHARQFAVGRVCEEIEQRFSHFEQKIRLDRHALARAQEPLMRAEAMREFQRRGGAKAFFDRLWPDMLEEALQRSRLGV